VGKEDVVREDEEEGEGGRGAGWGLAWEVELFKGEDGDGGEELLEGGFV
jgi:hypothetical protein